MKYRFTNNLQLIVYFCLPFALVAELVDALDSKSSSFESVGSIPTQGTEKLPRKRGVFMFYVYALSSIERKYIYVGLTNNLNRRIAQHNSGYEKTTKPYRPFSLILVEECSTRKEARFREKYWKSGSGKEKLKK